MKVEHKVIHWDPQRSTTDGVGGPEGLERALNQLGEQGWEAVAATASLDATQLIVLARSSPTSDDDVQVVQLALVHTARTTVTRLVGRASRALGRPEPPALRPGT